MPNEPYIIMTKTVSVSLSVILGCVKGACWGGPFLLLSKAFPHTWVAYAFPIPQVAVAALVYRMEYLNAQFMHKYQVSMLEKEFAKDPHLRFHQKLHPEFADSMTQSENQIVTVTSALVAGAMMMLA